MVAVVTGGGLGLERSSANVLGARGQLGSAALGRANDGVVVNAATGNLVIANRDELLIGRGPDIAINRTYNSLGQFTDENGDNWATIGSQVVGLTGTLNGAGSYLDRIGWDGGRTRFTYDTSRAAYVSKEGAGAYDTITYNGTNWTWTDGDTGIVEVYGAGYNDRVVSRTDRDGNAITYAYNGANGALFQITTDGGYTTLSWSGNNLTALTTTYWDPATSSNKNLLRTRYTYDGYNRLSTVSVDLSPEDSSITDGRVYVTTYTYHGTSKLVASIGQTDGSLLQISYDGSNRVSTLTETVEAGVMRTTSFAYQNGLTAITDAQGEVSELHYNGVGQLAALVNPASTSGGDPRITEFNYDADGNVSRIVSYNGWANGANGNIDALDNYRYDGNGNLYDRYQWVDGGYLVTRSTYGSQNQLLTSTTYTGIDPDGHGGTEPTGGMMTRYVYDAEMHLRFKISSEGRVTEYLYDGSLTSSWGTNNGVGQLTATVDYAGSPYTSVGNTPTEGDMISWRWAIGDKSTTQRTDYSYDFRGNLSSTISYAHTDAAGNGIFDAGASRTYYIYDQAGNLLSKRVDDGSQAETYAYDGTGRTIRYTDAKGVGTWTSYIDNQARTVVTLANGLTQTSAYNKVGELLTFSEARGGFATPIAAASSLGSWGVGGLTSTAAGTLDGAPATKYTVPAGSTWSGVSYAIDATAGDTFTSTVSLQAVGMQTTQFFGLYGYVSGWGPANISSARIISGPGTITISPWNGGLWQVSGLSTTEATRIEVTRTYTISEGGGAYVYVDLSGGFRAGQELIVAAPSIMKARYDESGTVQSFDAGQLNINNWSYSGATRESAGSIDGSLASKFILQSGSSGTVVASGFTADAGDTVTTAMSFMASGSANTAALGIYGYTSGWDSSGGASIARILAGPGTLVQEAGGLWRINGLSTTQTTRIEITRTFAQREFGGVYLYPDAIIVGAPSIVKTPGDLTSYKYDSLGRLRIKTDPAGKRSFFFYDKQGRKIGDVAADGAVAEYKYDAAGRVIASVQYAAALSSGQLASLIDGIGNPSVVEFPAIRPTASASDRWGWTIYDKAGRAVETIDAVGMTTEYVYDGAGRIKYQWKRYNTLSQSQLDGFKTTPPLTGIGPADHANDRITQFYYDGDGLLIGSMDEEMYLTKNIYDAAGRKIESIRSFNRSNPTNRLTDSWTSLLASAGTHAKDAHSYWLYDGIGRVGATIDAEGGVVHFSYDASGHVTREERGRKVTPNTAYTLASLPGWSGQLEVVTSVYDVRGQATSRTQALASGNVTASFGYDAMGVLTSTIDGRGNEVRRYYDARGRLVREDVPLDASTVTTTRYEYDSRGNVVRTIDARGNASYNYYDDRSRLVLQIDAEGYATKTTYTVFGEVASVRRYYAVASGIGSTATQPTLAAHAKDAVTSFTRDVLGRVTSTTDAENASETYLLDAFGQTYYSTNKLGGGTSYAYTRRGQLYYEYNNQLVVRSDGTTQANNAYKVVNVYDAFGNLVQLVEGNGLTERRDTYYTYDRNNRLIRTDLPAFGVFDAPTGSDILTTPFETYKYDARGNLIETVDAGGGRSLSYYDEANRRIATIDAVGTHRTYGYDADGNVTVERVYGTATALPGTAGGTPSAPSGTPREILYAYDRSNRLIEKRMPSVQTGQLVGTVYQRPIADLVTTYTYDANGNVVRETDARGNSVFHWYDKLGREIAKVDQENYLTRWDYDSEGNVTREWRYATALATTPSTASNPYDLAVSVRSDYIDRITDFTYDRMGRRTVELRFYVSAGTISGASATVGLTNSVIYYTYNAFGEVLSKTEATGDQSVYQYDSYGRLTRKLDPGFVDHAGANVRRATDLSYDGLDNLVREVSMEGNTAADAHVTRYVYGTGGRLKNVIDAAGGQHNYQYNIKGELRRDQVITQRSGGSSIQFEKFRDYDAVGRVTSEVAARWESSTGWVYETTRTTNYNAYGEVVSKGVNGTIVEQLFYDNAGRLMKSTAGDGVWKFFVYDANGNVTLSMASTAAADIGHWVQSDALANLMGSGALDIASFSQYYTTATLVTYDKRNLATETWEPNRTIANSGNVATTTTQTLNTRKWYNAFGEVVQDRGARGYITNYSYNTMGRVTQLQAPETDVALENGTTVRQRPTENYVYDVSGRLIGTQNANGSWTTRSMLAGSGYGSSDALVTAEYRPDGSVWQTKYDVHGNARLLTDGLNRTTTQSFDAMNRLTQVIRPSGLTEGFAYDALGQRTRHWNNVFQSPIYGTPVWVVSGYQGGTWQEPEWVDTSHWETPITGYAPTLETTDYDMTGRVISTKNYAGDVTNYTYSWNGGIVTSGLGSFGGWTKTTSTIADRYSTSDTVYAATETTDAFGRMVARTDMGGNSFTFAFNKAGQLVSETGGGNTRSYSYFNTGQLAQSISGNAAVNTNWRRTTVDYRYDAEGHRVYEKTQGDRGVYNPGDWYDDGYGHIYYDPPSYYETSALLADGRAAYDEMGRMKTWSDRNASGVDTAAVTWTYDAAGNVRSMSALYKAINADGSQAGSDTSQTWWYRYDALNRMVTTKGVLSGGTIVRGAMGIDLTYTAAGARAQMITGSGYGQKQESYTYFADGGLDQVSIAEGYGGSVLRADTSRDLLGRVDGYVEYNGWGGVTHERYALQYDLRGQVLTEKTRTLSGSDWIYAHTVNDYSATGAGTPGGEVYYGWYTGSSTGTVLFNARAKQWKNGSNPPSFASSADYALADTYTTYSYGVWRDGAVQTGIVLTNRDGTATSSYAYASDGSLTSVTTWGGAHPKTVSFTNDQQGRVLERVEADYTYSQSDPRERRYRFNGIEMGVVGNNGADDTDYATAIARRNAASGTGAFRGGAAYGTPFADFDQNYAGVNPSNERGTGSMWTARVGDTLSGIAAALWGDASRWYLIAEANGLGGNGPQGALAAGTSIVIPGGSAATNLFNNANTFKPYDPAKAIGDTQPNAPAPPRGNNGCGVFGQILLAVVAVAVTYFTYGALTGAFTAAAPAITTTIAGVTTTVSGVATISTGALIAAGALAGAAGSIASQVVGVATGIQDRFDWKGVALSGLSGAVGGAMGSVIKGSGFFAQALRGVAASAVTQGIATATGLQDRFDWTGVAAAGAGGYAGARVGGSTFTRSGASALANAATRSVIDGTDFGDNVMAALPDVIGQTVGGWVTGEIVGSGKPTSNERDRGDKPTSLEQLLNRAYGPGRLENASYFNGKSIQVAPGDVAPVLVVESLLDVHMAQKDLDASTGISSEGRAARQLALNAATDALTAKPLTLSDGFTADLSGLIGIPAASLFQTSPNYGIGTTYYGTSISNPTRLTATEAYGREQSARAEALVNSGGGVFAGAAYYGGYNSRQIEAAGQFGQALGGLVVGRALGPGSARAMPIYRPNSAIEGSLLPPRFIPSPNGKNGGPLHQAQVGRVFANIEARGLLPDTEYYVATPGGLKRGRFIDVVAIDRSTGSVVEAYQIGRQTKSGLPVTREARAITDITTARPNIRPVFVPYNMIGK